VQGVHLIRCKRSQDETLGFEREPVACGYIVAHPCLRLGVGALLAISLIRS
jgi:hypothetical protein